MLPCFVLSVSLRRSVAPVLLVGSLILGNCPTLAQAPGNAAQAKPTEHVLGTISAVDTATQTIKVKEDGSGTFKDVDLKPTRTLLKVAPGSKDISKAVRITPADLAVGDRVDVRGFPTDAAPTGIAARSLILMSSRDLQAAHQAESEAWRHATAGTVTSVDTSAQRIVISARLPGGPGASATTPVAMTVDGSHSQYLRYAPETPETPITSQLSEIQPGDQIRVLGKRSEDNTTITAEKVYSGSFKNVAGTISEITNDTVVVKDLGTKTAQRFTVSPGTAVHRLPAPMAYGLARRFNPDFKGQPPGASGPAGARPGGGASAGEQAGVASAPPAGMGQRTGGVANGDLGQMLNRLPTVTLNELKVGDAVIISGAALKSGSVLATAIIAGVEPIFQSASPRQAQSLGDWNNALGGGGAASESGPGQ